MAAFCQLDIKEQNWKQVREKLRKLGDEDQELDVRILSCA